MRDLTSDSFGILIAYLIPGFITLWGLSLLSPELRSWMGTAEDECHTLGGFLYATAASVGAGLTTSTVRWAVIDHLHHWTGVRPPNWNVQELHARTTGVKMLVQHHYHYYQFYANTLIALVFAGLMQWHKSALHGQELVGLTALTLLFFAGSRDTLTKYYGQAQALLKQPTPSDDLT